MQSLTESSPAWGSPGSLADELLRRTVAESRRLDESPQADTSIAAVYEMLFGQPHIHPGTHAMDDTNVTSKNAMDSGNLLADATNLDPEGQSIYEDAFESLFNVPAIPVVIGPYRILRRHASGGAGTVYLGIHRNLERKAAIKLAHPRIQGALGNRKLIEEASSLAKVRSDHVVQVYDCGECQRSSEVYIAMQFVAGTTLARWQHHQPRPWRELLRNYLRAGQGLADIHAANLLHRDFKPDNVLITDDGEVKIVDFGLACATGDDLPADTASMAGGTPRYMAPERLFDRPYDPRSDQYSFCVALFEALFGSHPFLSSATQSHRGTVPTADAPNPPTPNSSSTALEDLKIRLASGAPPARPANIRVPGRIHRALLRGLAHDPNDRFPSMQALLAELNRDPLRDSAPYALGLAGIGLVAGMLWWTQQPTAPPCTDLGEQLAGVWDDARREQVRTAFTATGSPHATLAYTQVERAMDRFHSEWLDLRSKTCLATHHGTQTAELDNLTMACLDRARSGTRAVVDRLGRADADTVLNVIDKLAELPDLADCSEAQIRRHRCLDSGAYPDVPEVRAAIDEARALEIASQFTAAEAAARTAVDAATAHNNRALAAETQFVLARILAERSDHQPAAQVFADAYRLAEAAECDALATDINNHRTKLFSLSTDLDPGEGRSYAEISFAKVDRLNDTGLLLAEAHNNLGLLLVTQDQPGQALPHHQTALAIRTRVAGPLPTPDVALSHLNIGSAHAELGATDAAIESFNRALTEFNNVYGEAHPRLWKVHFNLARARLAREDYAGAISEAELARPLIERSYGPRHRKVAELENLLAGAAIEQERYTDAKAHAERAEAIYARELPPGDIARLDTLRARGDAYQGLGEHAAAISVRTQAWSLATDATTRIETTLELIESLILGNHLHAARQRCDDIAAAIAVIPDQIAPDLIKDFTDLCEPTKPSPTRKNPHGDQ